MEKIEHPISDFSTYGQLTFDDIPEFASNRVVSLFNDCENLLRGTQFTVNKVRGTNYSDFKPEVAKQKKRADLLVPRKRLHEIIKKHIDDCEDGKKRIREKISGFSARKKFEGLAEQIDHDADIRENRRELKSMDPEEKIKAIKEDVQSGDGNLLRAAKSSNPNLLPSDLLVKFEKEFAFKQDPNLSKYEMQVNETARIVRKKCGELNSTQISMLSTEDLEDPISKREHFQTFIPRYENERQKANKLILEEEREQEQQERKAKSRI